MAKSLTLGSVVMREIKGQSTPVLLLDNYVESITFKNGQVADLTDKKNRSIILNNAREELLRLNELGYITEDKLQTRLAAIEKLNIQRVGRVAVTGEPTSSSF